MKAFAVGILAAVASAQDTDANGMGALAITELIDGILIGALHKENVEGLETCIKEFNPLVTTMYTAVMDFEDGSYYKVADGIYQLGQFISQVGVIMEDCPQACDEEDVANLKAMGEAFLHPGQLFIDASHNVIVNGV